MKILSQAEIDKLVIVERNYKTSKSFMSVGRVDVDFSVTKGTGGTYIWQYFLWRFLIMNCCDPNFRQGKNSISIRNRYTICEEWLSFANFLEWVNNEVDYCGEKFGFYLNCQVQLSGCFEYSPRTTHLLPKTLSDVIRKSHVKYDIDLPTGVRKHSGSKYGYYCVTSVAYRSIRTVTCDTPEEAFLVYKTAKEAQIKAVANQYKDVLKPAVYESLMNWEITP